MAESLPNNFLLALQGFIAAQASLAAGALAVGKYVETAGCPDPHGWIVDTPGPQQISHPLNRMGLRCVCVGGDDAAARALCWAIYKALCDSAGVPLRMISLTGWKIVSVEFNSVPGQLGVDVKNRAMFVFNAEIGFYATA